MVKNIFQAEYATVTYNTEKRMLVLIWHGSPTSEEYKKPFNCMLEFGRTNPVDSMLSDISKQGVIGPENRKWFEQDVMPRAAQEGLKRGAIVTNGNAFKLYYINLILSAINKFPIATKLFNNQSDAFAWLESFPVSTHSMPSSSA